jgi:hypothetical protein
MTGGSKPMDTGPLAEVLAQLARRKELIERSKKLMITSKDLVEQSDQLIRIAMGHDVDGKVVETRETSLKTQGK